MSYATLYRGGESTERLYLHDAAFPMPDGTRVVVQKSVFPLAPRGTDDVVARHKARYGLVSLFCRPGTRVLDVPCGSGYAADLLEPFGVEYVGVDSDPPSIEYARRMHGREGAVFRVADMLSADFGQEQFDVVACIEGLEHVEQQFQSPLIGALATMLTPHGVLVVSSPEPVSGVSGSSPHNPDHAWELSRKDFLALLSVHFDCVELITQRGIGLSTGVTTTCLYAVCHGRV